MAFGRLTLLIFALAVGASLTPAAAQNYPNKPVRIVAPFAVGGTTDYLARLMALKLGEQLGQSFIVDNRGGAGGTIGTDIVAKAAGDGYTLLVYHIAIATAPSLYKKLPYDTLRDIAPISRLGYTPSIMVVHPSMKVGTVKDIIAMAKASPATLNYGSAGVGSAGHIGVALFEYAAGVKLVHVPYKGGGPALIALSSGELQVMIQVMPDTIRQVRAGRLKLIAVSTAKRLPDLPDVPTISETVPSYEYATWFGMFAPGTTSKPLVAQLNGAINKIIATADTQAEFRKDGLEPAGNTPQEFSALLGSEVAKWAKVIKAAGIQPN